MSEYAPIVLFVFRRPEHTVRLLESLARNPEIAQSTLYVYCEGPRHEADQAAVVATRQLVRAFTHAGTLQVIERARNLGCAASIVAGIDEVLARHDRVIVLEDDLVLSRHFLAYMNAALTRYATNERVMHVSGYAFPCGTKAPSTFLPMVSSWGWGTWRRAWRHFDRDMRFKPWLERSAFRGFRFDVLGGFPFRKTLQQQATGRVDAWDIRWYLTVFAANGVGLFPGRSLTTQTGFGSDSTHETDGRHCERPGDIQDRSVTGFPARVRVRLPDFVRVSNYLANGRGWRARISQCLRELLGIPYQE